MVTKTPTAVWRGDPVTAKHEPNPREIVTLFNEVIEAADAAAAIGSRTALLSTEVSSDADFVQVAGYAEAGDGGAALYKRSASEPEHAGKAQSADGAWWEIVQSPISAAAMGAVGDDDKAAAIQDAIDLARSKGGRVVIPAGTYPVTGSPAIEIDYTAQTEEPVTQPLGVSVAGEGAHNTVLTSQTAGGDALKLTGGTGVAAHIYTVIEGFSIGGAAGAHGLNLYNTAFAKVRDLTIQGVETAVTLESVLSSHFENLTIGNGVNGAVALRGTGFSEINANTWESCNFRMLTGVGYSGGPHSGVTFDGCNFEACGTHDDLLTGGLDLTFSGLEGAVGMIMTGGYMEGNRGGWDINITSTAATPVTHVISGVNFNRISAASHVVNNIRATGPNKIILIGCTFEGLGDYVEDAGRLYVNADADTEVICIGCKFGSAAAQGSLRNLDRSIPFSGSVDGSGAALLLPAGWTCSRTAAGEYRVTHNLDLDAASYTVVATSEADVTRLVQRITKATNHFDVVTQDGSAVAADSAFGFQLVRSV